ncbi:P-loop containing nucleoside triphosphate hydrolase protein [Hypoxylon sp. FL1857]|nr:P-loop containing nucleoside triphosphate hydrolase protein [Hypoxylon sp. FL1857]
MNLLCSIGSDDQLGPRINTACRPFDFTLLFEDAFFTALPAALMVLLVPMRMRKLWAKPILTDSHRLAAYKSAAIGLLIVLQLVFLALRVQSHYLYTRLAIAADILCVAANVGALAVSFLEDQRSVRPSDLLVLYYSASTILGIPRLRTLWLLSSDYLIAKAIWTILFAVTAGVVVLECLAKTKHLRPTYKTGLTFEQTTSFWGQSFFIWLLPLFRMGYGNIFLLRDLPDVDQDLREPVAWAELAASWRRIEQGGRLRLVGATLVANKWSLLSAIVPRLFLSAFTFCQPFLIQAAVSHLGTENDGEDHERFGQGLVGAFALVYLGIAVSRAVYWRQTYRTLARIRVGLTSKIYRHTISLPARDVEDSAALTLMGTDVERIIESLRFVHEVWAAIPEVAIGVWLLARQVSYASIVPLFICVVSLVATSIVAKHFGPAQKNWVECVERRVSATASILSNIKHVKMLSLMAESRGTIERLRSIEIQVSTKFRSLRVWAIMVGNTPTTLAPFATLAVYSLIAVTAGDQTLLVTQAFTSLALITLVTEPLLLFCQALPSLIQAISCFSRIEKFFMIQPVVQATRPRDSQSGTSVMLREIPAAHSPNDCLVTFDNACISWAPEAHPQIVLHDLSLTIWGGFTAIIGPVGSGKSTLLSSIVGGTSVISGSVLSRITSRVAFCSQTPWLMNDTVERNIIGDSDFDQAWFDFSVSCSSLQEDLDNLPAGRLTVVGNNGLALSGGQRQRVALARAVYSKLPVVVLDDCTSGLDPTTSRNILNKLLHKDGHFRKSGISVILATHDPRMMVHMDKIIALDDGELVDLGSYEEMKTRRPELLKREEKESYESHHSSGDEPTTLSLEAPQSTAKKAVAVRTAVSSDSSQADARRQQGAWSVYLYYGKKVGKLSLFLWASFTLIGAVSAAYSTMWVDRWTSANASQVNRQLGVNLGVYFLLTSLSILGTLGECWSVFRFYPSLISLDLPTDNRVFFFSRVFFIYIIKDTAMKLHSDLLHAVLGFSQDMNLIDMTLPSQAIQFTTGFASCTVQLFILCVLGKYLAAVVPILAATLFAIQRYYLRTSRQLRILDIEAKAPLYAHFISTISGIGTIRTYGWETSLSRQLAEILNLSQRPFYMLFCVQQWLTLVLDLVSGALAITLVALALLLSGALGPGALGVALVLTLQFNGLLIQTIQSWTKLETSIGAVARVRQFVAEAPLELGATQAPSDTWPESGAVEFRNIEIAHTPSSVSVVKDLSLKIAAGEKLAICGPSGSGKSSLIMAVLKMMDLRSGQIFVGGTDISTVDGADVRSHLNVVPQEPYFMPGSLRFNIDPKGRASDASIESAIRRVSIGLWEKLSMGIRGNLDAKFVASEWSHGERQLLCLARALLVPSKIVIFDEAMSSVDENTEDLMQQIVENEFQDKTVISIIHRYSHIDWFDRVAILQGGRLVECDGPRILLQREGSALRELYRASIQ